MPKLTAVLRTWQTRLPIWGLWSQSNAMPMVAKLASWSLRYKINVISLTRNYHLGCTDHYAFFPSGKWTTRSQSILLWCWDGHRYSLWLLHWEAIQWCLSARRKLQVIIFWFVYPVSVHIVFYLSHVLMDMSVFCRQKFQETEFSERCPVSHYWDESEPRLFVCETVPISSETSSRNHLDVVNVTLLN